MINNFSLLELGYARRFDSRNRPATIFFADDACEASRAAARDMLHTRANTGDFAAAIFRARVRLWLPPPRVRLSHRIQ